MNFKVWPSVKERTVAYLKNTSIHGLRYIINDDSHWFERVFWLLVSIVSFGGTYFLFLATWSTYVNNPISFVTETTYLDWNTTFPAISICEAPNPEKIEAFGEAIFGEDRNLNYDTFITEVMYYGICSSCALLCKKLLECPSDVTSLVSKFRARCDSLLSHCSWNGVPFECCSRFEQLETQFGVCYTINSMQIPGYNKIPKNRKFDLVSNRKSGPGKLMFHINENADVSIHAPESVPFANRPLGESWLLSWGTILNSTIQVTEIVNDPMLREVPVDQRQCRFPDENPHTIYPYYSYSTCMVDCIGKEQIKLCGCVHHFMPKQDLMRHKTCTLEGLACLYEHREYLGKVRVPSDPNEAGITCDCMSSCTEPEYRILKQLVRKNPGDMDDPNFATQAVVNMAALPSQRFIRNVVRTKLDLVVSMGGTAGLFLGASLLSVVELFYYCCIRRKNTSNQEDKDQRKEQRYWARASSDFQKGSSNEIPTPAFYPKDYLSADYAHF